MEKELRVNWDEIPPEFKYVAQDKKGYVWAYSAKPTRKAVLWSPGDGDFDEEDCFYVSIEDVQCFASDWTTSLIRRPENTGNVTRRKLQVDWDKIPPEYQYAAQNLGGDVFLFEEKPIILPGIPRFWCKSKRSNAVKRAIKEIISRTDDWKISLIERPPLESAEPKMPTTLSKYLAGFFDVKPTDDTYQKMFIPVVDIAMLPGCRTETMEDIVAYMEGILSNPEFVTTVTGGNVWLVSRYHAHFMFTRTEFSNIEEIHETLARKDAVFITN